MAIRKSYEEINAKIRAGQAVVVTAEEIIPMVAEQGAEKVAQTVDVVTTATFGPMCSSGVFLNFGHSDPPIRMKKVWLNRVSAYAGLAAVDAYLGATEEAEDREPGQTYGGAHVIQELLEGRRVHLEAVGSGTDCYPLREWESDITLAEINEAILFNPRNAYQNYAAAINSSAETLYTYMGVLLPNQANVTYSTSGALSPLLNDPEYRTIGLGTRIFLGGAVGYVAGHGTQHNSARERLPNGVPLGGAATLSVTGNLKEMSPDYIQAAVYEKYGVSLFVGIGVPMPVLDADMVRCLAVSDADIYTGLVDYGVPRRARPVLAKVSYAELKSGHIELNGRRIPTAPLSSMRKARQIAARLGEWVRAGQFLLQEPAERLPLGKSLTSLNVKEGC